MEATAAREAEDGDVELLERLEEVRRSLETEIGRRVVGQQSIVEGLLIALLADGHALLVGVPGLAKTLLISTLADALDLQFSRIQFTPDLMPSDITGTEVLEEDRSTGRRLFRFVRGPIFANVVLADEINRTPPKTQAALLQAMQERAVTAAGETMQLDRPFFVLATQNPIEQEGTYPLPEAQLDRFMMELRIGYPTREEEERVAMQTTGSAEPVVRPVLGADELVALQRLVRRVPAAVAGIVCGAPGAVDATGRRGGARGDSPLRELGRGSTRVAVPGARSEGARCAGGPGHARPGGCAGGGSVRAATPRGAELPGRGGRAERGGPGRRAHSAESEMDVARSSEPPLHRRVSRW
jgi:MoxR-like ATPase